MKPLDFMKMKVLFKDDGLNDCVIYSWAYLLFSGKSNVYCFPR
jgi:hypothetical protein